MAPPPQHVTIPMPHPCPAWVSICRTNGRPIKVVSTDAVGQFYSFLKTGNYIVRARPQNLKSSVTFDPVFIVVREDGQLKRLDFVSGSFPYLPASTNISVTLGEKFGITLPCSPSAGYFWQIADYDASLLTFLRRIQVQPPPLNIPIPIVGRPENEIFVFGAIAPGQTTISLNYLPPGSTIPVRTTNFCVTVSPWF